MIAPLLIWRKEYALLWVFLIDSTSRVIVNLKSQVMIELRMMVPKY